jgi:hypothetical protein
MSATNSSFALSLHEVQDLDISSFNFSQNWSRQVDEPSISFLKDSEDPRISVILPSSSVVLQPSAKRSHKKQPSDDTSPTIATKNLGDLAMRLERENIPSANCSDCFRASMDGSCRLF